MKYLVTVTPKVTQLGYIDVPDVDDVGAYIRKHWKDIIFDSPELNYDDVSFDYKSYDDEHGYSFMNDYEKMRDFIMLSKDEFLFTYSYLNENDYDETQKVIDRIKTKESGLWAAFTKLVKDHNHVDETHELYDTLMEKLSVYCSYFSKTYD